ncbi:hypothetical protein B0H63DRAFT_267669 [Podospora didyma]|uniref:Uncharacterized protein n=1 Tax=Podospora didyma TaxID=330526 RepID=A0AAE0KFA3_9PEZI|nr:hypothetical protein B0H63DRAFT_267669 [Podospora didyma]
MLREAALSRAGSLAALAVVLAVWATAKQCLLPDLEPPASSVAQEDSVGALAAVAALEVTETVASVAAAEAALEGETVASVVVAAVSGAVTAASAAATEASVVPTVTRLVLPTRLTVPAVAALAAAVTLVAATIDGTDPQAEAAAGMVDVRAAVAHMMTGLAEAIAAAAVAAAIACPDRRAVTWSPFGLETAETAPRAMTVGIAAIAAAETMTSRESTTSREIMTSQETTTIRASGALTAAMRIPESSDATSTSRGYDFCSQFRILVPFHFDDEGKPAFYQAPSKQAVKQERQSIEVCLRQGNRPGAPSTRPTISYRPEIFSGSYHPKKKAERKAVQHRVMPRSR